jgi:calcineurin-like phosphoesterase family protein
MSKIWISSDYHCGENRYELMGRPFFSQQEMIDCFVNNHNKLVNKDDLVYILGDVCYQKTPEFLPQIEKFNGKKILVRGNHDRNILDSEFLKYFEEVIPEGEGINLDIEGLPCYLTHYPTSGKKDRFNLVGHIHSAWKVQKNMLNVGVDVHHFNPISSEKVLFYYNAICNFFDKDVWVYDNEINDYSGRGKNTTYLGEERKNNVK